MALRLVDEAQTPPRCYALWSDIITIVPAKGDLPPQLPGYLVTLVELWDGERATGLRMSSYRHSVAHIIGKLRDELLNGEIFERLQEAKVLIEGWRSR